MANSVNMVQSLLQTLLFLVFVSNAAYNGPAKHIVYFLLDDIGWSDISATGGQFPTPTIDELYNTGIVLNRHYVHHVCSQSRSQFLTGRRSMNLGYGKMTPWGYTRLGGIPIGQPTTANWFRDFVANNPDQDIPKYKTYGIGKWHVGYNTYSHTPPSKGFDHYYGFHQTFTDYFSKEFNHGNWGPYNLSTFDFFEDDIPAFDALDYTTNTMFLYLDKIQEYLDEFNVEQNATDNETLSMYLYLGVQTLHGPFKRFRAFTSQCQNILNAAGVSLADNRIRICEYTLMTEFFVDTVVTALKDKGFWDDTLLVFTGDNGMGVETKGCNYPLRGTKATLWDGNIRLLTFVNGGDNIINTRQRGSVRDSLISNIDWTPTLLSYAGILDYIDPADYEWDGEDVSEVILSNRGDRFSPRDHLLLNIRSTSIETVDDLTSAQVLFEYNGNRGDGHLYKYMLLQLGNGGADQSWTNTRFDGWCTINFTNNNSIYLLYPEDTQYENSSSIDEDNEYIFDLTEDEGEKFNLKHGVRIDGSTLSNAQSRRLRNYALSTLETEINLQQNLDFYHEPILCFWQEMEEGAPGNFEIKTPVHGLYVMPFLNQSDHVRRVKACFDAFNGTTTSTEIPPKLRDLYLNAWVPPNAITPTRRRRNLLSQQMDESSFYKSKNYMFVILCTFLLVLLF